MVPERMSVELPRRRRAPAHPGVLAVYRELIGQWVRQRRERRMIDIEAAARRLPASPAGRAEGA
jgi:hypothetical protein